MPAINQIYAASRGRGNRRLSWRRTRLHGKARQIATWTDKFGIDPGIALGAVTNMVPVTIGVHRNDNNFLVDGNASDQFKGRSRTATQVRRFRNHRRNASARKHRPVGCCRSSRGIDWRRPRQARRFPQRPGQQ